MKRKADLTPPPGLRTRLPSVINFCHPLGRLNHVIFAHTPHSTRLPWSSRRYIISFHPTRPSLWSRAIAGPEVAGLSPWRKRVGRTKRSTELLKPDNAISPQFLGRSEGSRLTHGFDRFHTRVEHCQQSSSSRPSPQAPGIYIWSTRLIHEPHRSHMS
jgi:hypothetical protein